MLHTSTGLFSSISGFSCELTSVHFRFPSKICFLEGFDAIWLQNKIRMWQGELFSAISPAEDSILFQDTCLQVSTSTLSSFDGIKFSEDRSRCLESRLNRILTECKERDKCNGHCGSVDLTHQTQQVPTRDIKVIMLGCPSMKLN